MTDCNIFATKSLENRVFTGFRLYWAIKGDEKVKIKVTYSENEQGKKQQHEELVKRLFPNVKIKETTPKDGFLHAVLTVPQPRKAKN